MAMHEPGTETRLTLGPDDAGRLVTSEEFAEALTLDPWRYERVDGRLVVMAPDGEDHLESASPWFEHLIVYKRTHRDLVRFVAANAWIRVDDGTDRIGDIGVYLVGDSKGRKVPDRIPELMFEIVSPGRVSHDRDYIEKRADYHRLGVREYVVIDRFQKTVTVFSYTPEGYQERILDRTGTYESPLLPGLAIPLDEAFPT
jgi:Uma2 family endonuclease